eukprot:TRINITY_DN37239_c5_g1_i1.p1 TRINITY_DN37239_c5_g1~~TRINITY_DN37239_c5_g1_i1.p1  ORF type:complete len:204 (+),score=23.86 TRINITY_DN37239_c5_g1_i1:1076-1687(+)
MDLEINIQGYKSQSDIFLLSLKGSDVVLGVQWLQKLGPVVWDFNNLTMDFTVNHHQYHLHGQPKAIVSPATVQSLERILKHRSQGFLMQLTSSITGKTEQLPEDLNSLIQVFSSIFEEPKSLPPHRSQDHHIPVGPGAQPTNVRPYRYPQFKRMKLRGWFKKCLQVALYNLVQAHFHLRFYLCEKRMVHGDFVLAAVLSIKLL